MGYITDKLKKENFFQETTNLPTQQSGFIASKLRPKIQPKQDLTTFEGLRTTAHQVGLGERTESLLAEKGEKPEKIFSGGFISDVFDTLNAIQYGVVGLIKGKTFSEGVKTRESFTKKDALGDFGIPGTIAGIALDIAVDPLTYIPIFGLGKALLKGVKGTGKVAGKVLTKAPLIGKTAQKTGNTLGRAFIYRFGQDPIYKEIAERSIKNIAVGQRNVLELVEPITKLDSAVQKQIANFRKAGKLGELPKDLLVKAKPAFDELDRLGKEAVNVGLLKKETYNKNVGSYISRLYKTKEAPEGVVGKIKGIFEKKPQRINLSRFKKRKDIPEDIREAMGEILEAGYPTAKGLVQLTSAVEKAKLFNNVAGKWGKKIAGEGFEKLPNVKSLGKLADKYVPKPIFDDIQEMIRVKSPLEKGLNKIVAGFKFGKVILNPATHSRNIMSNFILNNFEGLSPARLDIYGKAAKELTKKGKYYQEAQKVGLGLNTFASQEIKALLKSPEATPFIKKFGDKAKGVADKIANVYQKEEEFAKMAQFIFQRKKGLSPEEAWKIAERATFNYAQVTPFIRRLRESIFGFPFITFTYKATPQVAKTLITKPTKISNIGKIKQAIENSAGIDQKELARERASEPSWVRDGMYVKLPMKDKHGRSAYLDLTYILPFGDLMSGQLFDRDVSRETGLQEGYPEAVFKKAPFFSLIKELGKNQDFFGNKIFQESDSTEKQLGDVMRHLMKTYLPPLLSDQIPGGYRTSGEKRPGTISKLLQQREQEQETGGFQGRTLSQELIRQFGLKISPVDVETQEKFAEWEKEKAMRTLLEESGITKEFTRSYIPKEKEKKQEVANPLLRK